MSGADVDLAVTGNANTCPRDGDSIVAPIPQPPLVAHVVYRLDIGGLENGLVNLINNMAKDRYRHAIVCLTNYTNFRERIHRENVPVVGLDKQPGKDLGMYFRLWRALRRLRPDIIHTRNVGTLECRSS